MSESEYLPLVEKRLQELFLDKHPTLKQAALYSIIAPSKRIRPLMVLSIAGTKALDTACAIEMIHTYTLIHDDLPAMDNDDMRRGKPSLHIAEGEATAILTGDFLLTYAFEILSSYPNILKLVAKKIGDQGVIGGQILDLQAKTSKVSLDDYLEIAKKKTGALFSAAAASGAMINDTSPYHYEKFGELFGIFFQIIDDLQDEIEPCSIQSIIGIEKAKQVAEKFGQEALNLLATIQDTPSYLTNLITKHLLFCHA
jgi:geranylgeranyl diphosphate synthase type II